MLATPRAITPVQMEQQKRLKAQEKADELAAERREDERVERERQVMEARHQAEVTKDKSDREGNGNGKGAGGEALGGSAGKVVNSPPRRRIEEPPTRQYSPRHSGRDDDAAAFLGGAMPSGMPSGGAGQYEGVRELGVRHARELVDNNRGGGDGGGGGGRGGVFESEMRAENERLRSMMLDQQAALRELQGQIHAARSVPSAVPLGGASSTFQRTTPRRTDEALAQWAHQGQEGGGGGGGGGGGRGGHLYGDTNEPPLADVGLYGGQPAPAARSGRVGRDGRGDGRGGGSRGDSAAHTGSLLSPRRHAQAHGGASDGHADDGAWQRSPSRGFGNGFSAGDRDRDRDRDMGEGGLRSPARHGIPPSPRRLHSSGSGNGHSNGNGNGYSHGNGHSNGTTPSTLTPPRAGGSAGRQLTYPSSSSSSSSAQSGGVREGGSCRQGGGRLAWRRAPSLTRTRRSRTSPSSPTRWKDLPCAVRCEDRGAA